MFTLVTAISEGLQHLLCIRYLVKFQKDEVQAVIDSDSKVNAMTPAYAAKLGLPNQKTSVRV